MANQLEYEQETNNLRQTFILIFSLIVFSSCENLEEDIKNFIDLENLAVEQLTNSEIIYTENGHLKQKISAQSMERFSDKEERIELLGDVHFSFYQLNSLNKKSVLTCEKATINTTSNIMIANGSVNVTNGETKILSQQLIWEQDKKDRTWDQSYPFKTDFLHFDGEVSVNLEEIKLSSLSLKCTSDFADFKVLDVDTFSCPFIIDAASSSDFGISVDIE